jgi:outer membrane protein TolC
MAVADRHQARAGSNRGASAGQEVPAARGRRFAGGVLATAAAALLLGACAVKPDPLTEAETQTRIDQDLSEMFADQEPLGGPVTLHDAMARAILYNLENRVQIMERALAERQFELSSYDMLPQVLASAGIEDRSNTSASSSRSITTGQESLETSTSLDDRREVADVTFVFNVLDFGVSYFNARQQGNRAYIAAERRRKVVHGIIQDVRSAYWRAVAAQRVLGEIEPLMGRVMAARNDAATIRQLRLQSPLDALTYERTLVDTLRQLQQLRSQLSLAKTELAALMNLPLDRSFTLADPADQGFAVPTIAVEPAELERLALAYRPELREESYQTRISADETRKAIARMLPGLELDAGFRYDSNSFLLNNEWYEASLQITWNLVNLLRGPASINFAEAQEQLVETRRQALSMAVLTQLYVAWIGYRDAVERFETAADLLALDEQILNQRARAAQTGRTGQLPVIQAELDRLVATLRRDLAYADVQNAAGNVFLAVGADPLPATVDAADVATLSTAIQQTIGG